jgi:hypothetical protein
MVISLGDHAGLRLDDFNGQAAGYFYGSNWHVTGFPAKYAGTGWHHFAYTVDGSTAHAQALYVDGVRKAYTVIADPIAYSGSGTMTYLGRHAAGGTTYDLKGMLDEVQVYNRALTAAEVQALVNVPSPCPEVATASRSFWKELIAFLGYLGYVGYVLIILRRR